MRWNLISHEWPALPFADWESTCDTLHMWTQIVGKTRLALSPMENHWWNVPFYVTPRGLGTSAIPCGADTFEMEFDLVAHHLVMRKSSGSQHFIRLYARSVADFYAEYMAALRALGIEARIYRKPVEFDDVTPFDEDQHHASYDTIYVERFRRILIESDRIFKQFRSRFLGKSSPVHFFWGSFDLAVTRFSGRRAPQKEGVDPITREAYSHEVASCGFCRATGGSKTRPIMRTAPPACRDWTGRLCVRRRRTGTVSSASSSSSTRTRAPHPRPIRRYSSFAKAHTRPGRNSRNGTAPVSSAPSPYLRDDRELEGDSFLSASHSGDVTFSGCVFNQLDVAWADGDFFSSRDF